MAAFQSNNFEDFLILEGGESTEHLPDLIKKALMYLYFQTVIALHMLTRNKECGIRVQFTNTVGLGVFDLWNLTSTCAHLMLAHRLSHT
uniref:Uncharacterized protein n=1 Tax=Salix viminalis TaxID=40686 RepID=A0A6N2N3K4_SALVM